MIKLTGIAYFTDFSLAASTTIVFVCPSDTSQNKSFTTDANGAFMAKLPTGHEYVPDKIIGSVVITET